jgi:MFS family permease
MIRLSRNYRIYWASGVFWALGLMVYFLVYNLYLLDLGFDEAFVGQVSAAFTIGNLAITLPTGWLLNRYGMKRVILASAFLTGITFLGRVIFVSPLLLESLAFANGVSIGAWIVATPPFITESTTPQVRSWAFSLWYGTSIGMGVLAGLLVGLYSKHPGVLMHSGALGNLAEKKALLFGSSSITLTAIPVLLFLTEIRPDGRISSFAHTLVQKTKHRVVIQSGKFVRRMMVVLALWGLFIGSFPSFFNVFFYRQFHQSLEGIGWIFSFSQLCQVAAVLCMPALVSYLGRSRAIPTTQFLSAMVLPLLVTVPRAAGAGALYIIYLSFQVMTEPALENFIMDSVLPEERPFVSSLRYSTHFLVQAIAVWLTGLAIHRVGYPVVLVVIASVGIAASISFYLLFHRRRIHAGANDPQPVASIVSTEPQPAGLPTCKTGPSGST